MSTENENDDTSSQGEAPDKSSKPAVAVTQAPRISLDSDGEAAVASASHPDGQTVEHEVDPDRGATPVDVDAVLTDDESDSDDGPPEPPA